MTNKIKQDYVKTVPTGIGLNVISSCDDKKYVYSMGSVDIDANGYYYDYTNKQKQFLPLASAGSVSFVSKSHKESGEQIYFKITGAQKPFYPPPIIYGDLSVDDKSNVYIILNILVGMTGNYIYDFNGKQLNDSYVSDYVTIVAKLNKYGHQEWYKTILSTVNTNLSIAYSDSDDCVYVTGPVEIRGTTTYLDFDSIIHIVDSFSGPATIIYIAKFSSFGKQLWFTASTNANGYNSTPYKLVLYKQNVYITGQIKPNKSSVYYYYDFATAIQQTVNFITTGSNNSVKFAFVTALRKYDGGQIFMSVASGNNIGNNIGTNLVVSNRGIFVGGSLALSDYKYYNFDQVLTITNTILPSTNNQIAFVAKLCFNGSQEWFKYASSISISTVTNLVLNDGIYAVGNMGPLQSFDFNQNSLNTTSSNLMFVVKFSYDGNQDFFKWTSRNTAGTLVIYSAGISADFVNYNFVISDVKESYGIYVSGVITPSADGAYIDFNGDTKYSKAGDNSMYFVAHILPNGFQTFYKIIGTASLPLLDEVILNGISSSDNNVIVTSTLNANTWYDFNQQSKNLPTGITNASFIAKLSYHRKPIYITNAFRY